MVWIAEQRLTENPSLISEKPVLTGIKVPQELNLKPKEPKHRGKPFHSI